MGFTCVLIFSSFRLIPEIETILFWMYDDSKTQSCISNKHVTENTQIQRPIECKKYNSDFFSSEKEFYNKYVKE